MGTIRCSALKTRPFAQLWYFDSIVIKMKGGITLAVVFIGLLALASAYPTKRPYEDGTGRPEDTSCWYGRRRYANGEKSKSCHDFGEQTCCEYIECHGGHIALGH